MAINVGSAYITLDGKDKGAQKMLTDLNSQLTGLTSGFNKLKVALGGLGALKLFGDISKQARDFELAFAGIRKTVDASEKEFGRIEKQLRTLAKTIPVSAKELANIGEIGGQLGIQAEGIVKFTETIAKISVATNLTKEQAAQDFARIANVMQEPIENIDKMASAVVDLGNNFATNETQIVGFTNRITAAGRIAGLTTADLFGISAAFTSVGIEAEAGGTAVSKALIKIDQAVVNGGKDLEGFAAVAGLTAKQFRDLWEKDAGEAFNRFVIGLGKQGKNASVVLGDLVAEDVRLQRAFLSAANAGDLFTEAIRKSNTAFEENVALEKEAATFFNTTQKRLEVLNNRWNDLAITFGNILNKQLIPLYEKLTDLGEKVLVPLLENYLVPLINGFADFEHANFNVKVAVLALYGAIATKLIIAIKGLVLQVSLAAAAFVTRYLPALASMIIQQAAVNATLIATSPALAAMGISLSATAIKVAAFTGVIGALAVAIGYTITKVLELINVLGELDQANKDAIASADQLVASTEAPLEKNVKRIKLLREELNALSKDNAKNNKDEIDSTKKLLDTAELYQTALEYQNEAAKKRKELTEVQAAGALTLNIGQGAQIKKLEEEIELYQSRANAFLRTSQDIQKTFTKEEQEKYAALNGYKKKEVELTKKTENEKTKIIKTSEEDVKEKTKEELKILEDKYAKQIELIKATGKSEEQKNIEVQNLLKQFSSEKDDLVLSYLEKEQNAQKEIQKGYEKTKEEAVSSYQDINKKILESLDNIQDYGEEIKKVEERFEDLKNSAKQDIFSINNELKEIENNRVEIAKEADRKIEDNQVKYLESLSQKRYELEKKRVEVEKELEKNFKEGNDLEEYKNRQEIAKIIKEIIEINKELPDITYQQYKAEQDLTFLEKQRLELTRANEEAKAQEKARMDELLVKEQELIEKKRIAQAIEQGGKITIDETGEELRGFVEDEKGQQIEITNFKNIQYAQNLENKRAELEAQRELLNTSITQEVELLKGYDNQKRTLESNYGEFFATEKAKQREIMNKEIDQTKDAIKMWNEYWKAKNSGGGNPNILDEEKPKTGNESKYFGGFTSSGNPHEVAGVVHKGEYVIPNSLVKQLKPTGIFGMLEGLRVGGQNLSNIVSGNSNVMNVTQNISDGADLNNALGELSYLLRFRGC